MTIVVGGSVTPEISIQVGSAGSTVDEVSFTVPAASVGNSSAITGAPAITITVTARALFPNTNTATLSVDSSTPLSNGSATIPFSEISWTASDSDIPSGTFNGGSQTLMSFQNSRTVFNDHTFAYANTTVPVEGDYTGRVTYTLTMP